MTDSVAALGRTNSVAALGRTDSVAVKCLAPEVAGGFFCTMTSPPGRAAPFAPL